MANRPNNFDPNVPAANSTPRDGDDEIRRTKLYTQNGYNDMTSTDRNAIGLQTHPIYGTAINATTGFTGNLNGSVGATTPSTGAFTTVSATSGVTGNLTGNIVNSSGTTILTANSDSIDAVYTGTVTGNVTGNVEGNVTGTLTGASAGAHNGSVGATTPNTGAFTTLSASTSITGDLTGASNGAHNGTVGATTPATGAFTTVNTSSDVTVGGNLTVNGTTTTVNSNTVNIGDNIITLNSDEVGTPSQNAGIEIERGTAANVSFVWDETNDRFTTGTSTIASTEFIGPLTGNVTGNISGGTVSGNGSGVTNINASNIASGTIDDAYLPDTITSNITGNVTGNSTGAHNGTVGATTPNTGAFSTISSSAAATLNSVVVNGFTVAADGANAISISVGSTKVFQLDNSGNLIVLGNVTSNAGTAI